MHVESFGELLRWTSGYHLQMAQCFRNCAMQHQNERSTLLLDYLADKELRLAACVLGFKHQGEDSALNTWCTEHLDKHPLMADAACEDDFASMTTSEIIAEVEQQHQLIILLYQNLYERSNATQLQQLLANVRDLEVNESQQMMHGANQLEDI